MRRLFGFALFCTAIGLLIGLFISSVIIQAAAVLLLLLIGYNLFVC